MHVLILVVHAHTYQPVPRVNFHQVSRIEGLSRREREIGERGGGGKEIQAHLSILWTSTAYYLPFSFSIRMPHNKSSHHLPCSNSRGNTHECVYMYMYFT